MEKQIKLFMYLLIFVFIYLSVSQLYAQDAESVVIGGLEWKTSNAIIFTYRNGDPIPQAKDESEWNAYNESGTGCWCYYNYARVPGIYETYINYNWYAVKDPRGLAPKGWRVPTFDEWDALFNNVGFGKVHLVFRDTSAMSDSLQIEKVGNKMTTDDLKGKRDTWMHLKGTNESKFNGEGYAWMCHDGTVGGNWSPTAVFWTSTEVDKNKAVGIFMQRHSFAVKCLKNYGYSVRFVKEPKKEEALEEVEDDLVPELQGQPEAKIFGFELKFSVMTDLQKKVKEDNKWVNEPVKVVGRSGMCQKRWDPNSMFIKSSQKDLYVNQTSKAFYISFYEDEWGTMKGYYKIKGVMSDDKSTLESFIVQFVADKGNDSSSVYQYEIAVSNVRYEKKVPNMAGRPGFYQYGDMKSVVTSFINYNKYGETIETCTTVNQDNQENGSFFFDAYFK